MKKTKKIVALLLTLCMAFGMFAHMAPVNAAPAWFDEAQEIETLSEFQVIIAEGESAYFYFEATDGGLFEIQDVTSTSEDGTPYVKVYNAAGEILADAYASNFRKFVVDEGETYYIEFYSEVYDWNTGVSTKVADQLTVQASVNVVLGQANIAGGTVTVAAGGTALYSFTANADGFVDFKTATCATEGNAPFVTVYSDKADLYFSGNINSITNFFVKNGETYIFEFYANKNYQKQADTITWSAELCTIVDITIPTSGKTVVSETPENGSVFYKYTSTVNGYVELMDAVSEAYTTDPKDITVSFAKFKIYDADGRNIDSGIFSNIDPISVKTDDVIYIEVYSQYYGDTGYVYPEDTITWEVEAYECGTAAFPEEITDMREFYQELTLDPNSYGHYYEYTATEEGEVVVYLPNATNLNEVEVIITIGENTYKYSESTEQVVISGYMYDDVYKALKVNVAEDDVLNIHVLATGQEVNVVNMVCKFTPPVGRSGNPLNVTEAGAEIEIAAGTTYHIQIPYGMAAVLEATGAFTVIGTDYDELLTEEMESVNGKLTVKGCYKLAITNEETTAITVNVGIEYPEGSMDNPYKLSCYNELDLRYDAYQSEFDYYTFEAKEDCTLYFDMPEIEADAVVGWVIEMYVFGDETEYRQIHPWVEELNNEVSLNAGESVIFFIAPAAMQMYENYEGEMETYVYPNVTEATRIQCTIATITENPFTDIEAGQYYETPVLWAYANDITAGLTETNFGVGTTCTRAQIVTFLWRAAGCPDPVATESTFTDLTDTTSYFYKAVLWAAENGITSGYEDGSFGIDDPCTRAQIVTFLWRAADRPAAAATTSPFTDVADANAYYYNAVLWAVENGITYGYEDGSFGIDDPCTREQVVTFLYRAFN